jgi:hypothetical protein
VEDITLSNHACPICGNEAAKGNRYCTDCDYDGSGSQATRSRTGPAQAPKRSGGSVPLVLLFFVVSAFGTVLTGMFAPNVLSIPLMRPNAVVSTTEWGELRVARIGSRIRAQASTTSDVVGNLSIGDSVRVEPVPNGWFRVYSAELVSRAKAKPLGFVYGTLLNPAGANVVSAGLAPPAKSNRSSGR